MPVTSHWRPDGTRLVGADGRVVHGPSLGEIRRRRAAGEFLWIDLRDPEEAALSAVGDEFGLHELAVEDSLHFGQRPKAEDYDDHVFLVAYGVGEDDATPVEVHFFVTAEVLVTVHRDECPAFAELLDRMARRRAAPRGAMAVHAVLDALTDSFFPALQAVEDDIDAIDERLVGGEDDVQHLIFATKRRLTGLARIARPQRDMVGKVASGLVELPGSDREAERHLRDVYDHLLRVEDAVDADRDLLNGATEVHLAAVSNRLNDVMKKLTLIATVFLPLTFVTGYFGQNFPWMVENIGGAGWFVAFGVVLQVAIVVGLVALFRRRGWV